MDPGTAREAGRTYIAIDLKSFYASVECRERGLDPLTTHLVVADPSRTEKTICLAVSPSLKAYGLPGRCRLFEVVQKVKKINEARRRAAGGSFSGDSFDREKLSEDPSLELSYLTAVPRMALYMDYSTRIYQIYLKYIAPEDIHVYSIDEVFMDVTAYLPALEISPHELARRIIGDVYASTGITATAGIGTNLYLAKVAMDIVAKHIPADEDGVRIASLDEKSYRRLLWTHRPLTDFWRVGKGYQRKLEGCGLYTMGDIARCSLGKETDYYNEDLLYKLFGVAAELLIDHAWGWEPCTMKEIKAFVPESSSVGEGQVLDGPSDYRRTGIVVLEMARNLSLHLMEKGLVTDRIVLHIGFDRANLPEMGGSYRGEISDSYYGIRVPKPAHGTANLKRATASSEKISGAVMKLYARIMDPSLLSKRIYLTAVHVEKDPAGRDEPVYEQLDLFADFGMGESERPEEESLREKEEKRLQKEKKAQEAVLSLQKKFGKNAVLRAADLQEGATARERNSQIGGHRA